MRSILSAGLLGFATLLAACSDTPSTDKKPDGSAATAPPPPPPTHLLPPAERRVQALHRIDSLEARIKQAIRTPEKQPDIQLAMHAIKAYHYFALDFPQDPRAPEALDRAGQLYSGVLGDHRKAVEFYEKAYTGYPRYPALPRLLFQEGVAYDAAGDTTNAITAWRRLLVAYPAHALSKEARSLIKLARMSEAERQQMFRSQPKAEGSARR